MTNMRKRQYFGGAPVPYGTLWDSEASYSVERCPHARMPAVCQPHSPGEGKPLFGPRHHFNRQRELVVLGLCDLCARPLKGRTAVSLSAAKPRPGAEGWAVMQFEPLLHRDCAVVSMRHCPWLRGRLASGEMQVRQVTRWRAQISIMSAEGIAGLVPGYTGPGAAGAALVELQQWRDRDVAWLGALAAAT